MDELLNPSDLIPGRALEYVPDGTRWLIEAHAQAFYKGGEDVLIVASIQEVGYKWVPYGMLNSQWRLL